MSVSENLWLYGGGVLLAGVSSSIFLTGYPIVWAPMPIVVLFAALFSPLLAPLVTPFFYMLVLFLFSRTRYFAELICALILLVGTLSLVYFQYCWSDGVMRYGTVHMVVLACQTAVILGISLALSGLAVTTGTRVFTLSANLLLFLLLSWCGFPYLGEGF